MFTLVPAYRIKFSIWLRQLYVPGVRGAVFILLINLLIALAIHMTARRMARLATRQAKQLTRSSQQLAYAPVNK